MSNSTKNICVNKRNIIIFSLMFLGFFSLFASTVVMAANFSGSLQSVQITDANASNKPPVAVINHTINNSLFNFDASKSTDPDGSIVQYKWDFGDGTTGTGAVVTHAYPDAKPYQVTLTVVDDKGGVALIQETVALFSVAINFQPATSPIPTGFLVDSGNPFNSTLGYGWTTPPASVGTRDRNNTLSPDQAYDTLICALPTGVWEYQLPNDTYTVRVCVGDPTSPDTTQAVQIEGKDLIVKTPLSLTQRWIEKEDVFVVADGRLTVTLAGSTMAKLCWIKISAK